jgi:phosphoribosylglycinamide formyltransferase 2
VLLLGGGELGKEVVIALQRLGVEVIVVDRYDGAPAQQLAHRSHVIDMTDASALRGILEKERPHLIVPEIEAINTDILDEIERSGISEVIPNARAVRLTMNREGIRTLASERLHLPTSPYVFTDSLEGLRAAVDQVGFPCFVKPIMSSSGKGQSMLRDVEDVESAWRHAQEAGRVQNQRIIVEGKIDFDYEITLLTIRSVLPSGEMGISFCEPIGHLQLQGDYVESWQPQPMESLALEKAKQIAGAIVENLGGRGLFGVELFVKGSEVWFSEVSPRPHDTGMVTMISQYQSEFDLHARAILGFPVDPELHSCGASAVIYGAYDGEGLCFDGVEVALQESGTDLRLFGKPIAFVRRRMGVALARASALETARQKAQTVARAVKPRLG